MVSFQAERLWKSTTLSQELGFEVEMGVQSSLARSADVVTTMFLVNSRIGETA